MLYYKTIYSSKNKDAFLIIYFTFDKMSFSDFYIHSLLSAVSILFTSNASVITVFF
jgi:hypothetical protein